MFLENVFPPIPSELIMPLAGLHTVRGQMNFWGAVGAGSVGSLLGTYLWYCLGCRVGEARLRSWTARHGRWLSIEPEDIDRASGWFQRHGFKAVFICRMIPGLRTFISLPAGFHGMPLSRFLAPSIAGTLLWNVGLTYAGHALADNYVAVKGYIGFGSWMVLSVVTGLYVWRQVRGYIRHRSSRGSDEVAIE
jgi:membrane protein DedA with SNARE-associated domain